MEVIAKYNGVEQSLPEFIFKEELEDNQKALASSETKQLKKRNKSLEGAFEMQNMDQGSEEDRLISEAQA
jgi:hypothetical protein